MTKAARPKDPMSRKALAAFQSAVAKVVERHRREGRPLAVWQDGKAVLVSPEKVSVVRESRPAYRTRARKKA